MNSFVWGMKDSWTMLRRNVKLMIRDPDSLIISAALPVILMLMFVYVFGGAIETGTAYINYVVPGIIITCVGYSSSLVASSINVDVGKGLYDRLRTMPVRPISLLFSHVAASIVRNTVSATLVIAVALAIGFRPAAGFAEWLAAIGLLLLFLIAFSWLGLLFGLLAKTPEMAGAFAMVIMFIPYLSSAFVPTDTMPRWLAAFSEHQPLTPMIESLRALLIGAPDGAVNHAIPVLWLGGLLILACWGAVAAYRRRSFQ